MDKVTITELQSKMGLVQDLALKAPVSVTRNGREKFVFMTSSEYKRLKKRDREALSLEELSEQDVRDIAASNVPDEYAYLDELMED